MKAEYDVVVIGGGVIGCAVTYELAKRSVSVLLIDKSLPGRATSASAGGLWPVGEAVGLGCGVIYHASQTDADSISDDGKFGPDALPVEFQDFLVESNSRFERLAEELRDLSGIDIEYDRGHGLLFAINDERERSFVEHIRSNLSDAIAFETLTTSEVQALEPGLSPAPFGGALLPGEDQVNPMLLAEAYKRAAMKLGAIFQPQTSVRAIRVEADRVSGVETQNGFVPCPTVVNAAGAWASRLASTAGLELPVKPVRGQVVLTEALPPSLSLCLSTSSTYLLQKRHGEILIGSTTEDVGFDASVTQAAIQKLCRGAIRCLPMLRDVSVKRVWAGLRPGTPDELPILGKANGLEGYVNATGGFRTGIVASPLTGEITAQLITGEAMKFSVEPFEMRRFERTACSPLTT